MGTQTWPMSGIWERERENSTIVHLLNKQSILIAKFYLCYAIWLSCIFICYTQLKCLNAFAYTEISVICFNKQLKLAANVVTPTVKMTLHMSNRLVYTLIICTQIYLSFMSWRQSHRFWIFILLLIRVFLYLVNVLFALDGYGMQRFI